MVITLIVDSYAQASNGTTMTTRRFAEVLMQHGHTVKIAASTVDNIEPDRAFELGISKIPVLYQVSKSQGFIFAKKNKKVIEKAIEGSDVVHFLLPFGCQRLGKKLCDKAGIPTTAAFHLQPENITSTLHMNKLKSVNNMIYRKFKKFYNKFNHVHCPSKMIANQLIQHGYTANLHVISNGVSSAFHKKEVAKPEALKDKYVILMVGRYSVEKRQDLIINAVLESKYESKIQIILAGKGPWEGHLKSLGEKLTNPLIFGFYDENELLDVINYSDLYVHSSDAEIEAISCMEAFTCGLVPIISDSKISATNQFALDEHNLFEHGNYHSLKEKIEYYIEHPLEKEKRSLEYIEYAKQYSIDNCVKQLEDVFELAIKEKKEKKS
ncbi:MAG: glycosyltransferase [Anaeroplasmataceae bacterium]|nr:glycosyltransferase [Anaeroplasmataceae bacterium]MDE6414348.1 glycosyltransferase [Anaeroplasmataceae bacterium]